jgi:ABC-type spermidine/putrescine transport system permease subunit II
MTVEGTPLIVVKRQNQSSQPKSSFAQYLYAKRWTTKRPVMMPRTSETTMYSVALSRTGSLHVVAVMFLVSEIDKK